MVGINGIGGIPEPANAKQVQDRTKAPGVVSSEAKDDSQENDGVTISGRAERAAEAAEFVANSPGEFIREEKVAAAKQDIEEGTHHVQEVVLDVAKRIARLVG